MRFFSLSPASFFSQGSPSTQRSHMVKMVDLRPQCLMLSEISEDEIQGSLSHHQLHSMGDASLTPLSLS